jgi:hypothetical protein
MAVSAVHLLGPWKRLLAGPEHEARLKPPHPRALFTTETCPPYAWFRTIEAVEHRERGRRAAEFPEVVLHRPVWQSANVRKRSFHRVSAVLGMVAMLGALIALPMTTSMVLAMAAPPSTAATADHQMPCHKPVKPSPHCPDLGTCLVKCFQPLSAPVAEIRLLGVVVVSRVLPEPTRVVIGSRIPPLLRPPSV